MLQHSEKTLTVDTRSVDDQSLELKEHDGTIYRYNLASLLEFQTDLAEANAKHASFQSFWEHTAIDLGFKAREFEEQGYAKWWAHARLYARFAMRAYGVKDTIDNQKDMVISIFSSDVSDAAFAEFASKSWRGYLLERYGTEGRVDRAIKEGEASSLTPFSADMARYREAGWPYERVMSTLRNLQRSAECAKAVAKCFAERSFKMHEFTELEKAKLGNIGPMSIDTLVQRVAEILLPRISSDSRTIPASRRPRDDRALMESVSKTRKSEEAQQQDT